MTTKHFLNTFKAIETVINSLVRTVVNIFIFAITEIAPMVAPLPPAFSIYTAMSERLHVPFYVAIVASVAIEIIGMFSSKVSIRCYQWNAAKTKTEQSVPQGLSILMTGVFFVVVLLLALTVELAPGLTALVIPGFVLIAISVYINLAIHTNLEKLETDKATERELRQEKRGLKAEIKMAIERLAALTAEFEKTQAEIHALTETVARLKTQKRHLEAQKLTPSQSEKPVSTDDPPNFSPETIARAREVYDRFTAEGHTRFGAALGREVGVNDRNGRKLVEYFRSLNGALNGKGAGHV